jgi:hypothetical protein
MWAAMALAASSGQEQAALERAGSAVLGGWAVTQLASGSVGYATADPPRARAFWGTNAAWNTVNLGLAGVGLATAHQAASLRGTELAARQRRRETALWVNAGLDVLYIASGVALGRVGAARDDPSLLGVGDSLVVQGGFLLAFDVGFATVHRARRRGAPRPRR